jgi:hypothetical protein
MIKIKLVRLRRYINVVMALAVAGVVLVPLFGQQVSALGGLVTSRSIQLSNSTPSATSTTYNVSFKATSAATVGGILIDFCSDSPIIGSTSCTYPTGFTLGTTVTVSGLSGFTTNTGWVTTNSLQCGAAASNFQVLELTSSTPYAPSSFGSTPINFQITGVTNTSNTGTFYARIYTFDTAAHTPNTAAYCPSSPTTTRAAGPFTGELDYGGDALSTATNISLTATVMETLNFCVSAVAPGTGCTGTSAPTLTLGHGSPKALDSTAVDTATAYTQVSSNAGSGVVVTLKDLTSTTCAGLSNDGGTSCTIPAIGAFGVITAGTADFGLNVADGAGGTGSVTHNANYGTTAGSYGMGTATYGTYGDPIESSSSATANVNSLLTYGATTSPTTPAGVYSVTDALIATGTY